MSELRLVLADDHPIVRAGLTALLSTVDGISVVGEADSGPGAVRLVMERRPDVVVMDVQMPGGDGITAVREIARIAPSTATLMLTMFDDDESVFAAMRAGARGYVLKGAGQDELVRAVRAVCAGEAIFGPGIARRVLGFMTAPRAQVEPFPELTRRENEVLNLLAAGSRNQAIATSLGLSAKTISNLVSTIFAKLQVADRAEAIVRARNAGLGRDGPSTGLEGPAR